MTYKKSDKVKAKLGKVNGQVSDSHCKVRAEYLATSLTMSDLGKSENGLLKVNKGLEQKQCIEKGCMGKGYRGRGEGRGVGEGGGEGVYEEGVWGEGVYEEGVYSMRKGCMGK